MIRFVFSVLSALFLTGYAFGGPLVEKYGRIELNWSKQRINFFGLGDEGSFTASEEAAWKDGLSYLVENLPKIRSGYKSLGSDAGKIAAHKVASSTYRVQTIYYTNGAVKVVMESLLAKALLPTGISFDREHPLDSGSRNSRIVIRLAEPIKPSPLFRIKAGREIVYSYHSVARSSFEKMLLGSVYIDDGRRAGELGLGENPVIIDGSIESGDIIVSEDDWRSAKLGNEALISKAFVSLSIPQRG